MTLFRAVAQHEIEVDETRSATEGSSSPSLRLWCHSHGWGNVRRIKQRKDERAETVEHNVCVFFPFASCSPFFLSVASSLCVCPTLHMQAWPWKKRKKRDGKINRVNRQTNTTNSKADWVQASFSMPCSSLPMPAHSQSPTTCSLSRHAQGPCCAARRGDEPANLCWTRADGRDAGLGCDHAAVLYTGALEKRGEEEGENKVVVFCSYQGQEDAVESHRLHQHLLLAGEKDKRERERERGISCCARVIEEKGISC